ncbi:MAG TPA: bifunctional diguanylate cyclase/phosphodiesterase [Nocardioidaceae bacterium]|nr:bifunctional diguanylate cyclase/phosphodiesterase [Nocardioidaceae bacterium]
MSSPPRAARASGTRLFAGYAVASLLPILVLGTVLAGGNRQDGIERGLGQGRAQAAVIEEMAIAPALEGNDLGRGLSRQESRRLREATDLAIYRGSVVRLLLRSFDGQVVFSDDGSVDDAVPASDPSFAAAARGSTDVRVTRMPHAQTGGQEGGGASMIRVLQPVIANASGRAVGVLELHLPFDEVAADVHAATERTYWRLGGGLAILYVVLALISWSTSRRLRAHAARSEYESLHDPLTGLPNRKLFEIRLEEYTRRQDAAAVVQVDLDRFKKVNDTLGHRAGDKLLCEVAARLRESLRAQDTVARLGGDEFGLLLPGVRTPAAARALLERAERALSAEILIDGVPLTMDASFGVAFHPRHAGDVEALLHCADSAMYHGKRGMRGTVVYHPSIAVSPSDNLSIQGDMRRAIDNDELRLHYQPIVDLATGEVTRLEALLRWQHPERGLLLPGDFLPAVEQTSLIAPMTDWVLRQALHDHVAWTSEGHPWAVAVNVSARNLDSQCLADSVLRLLEDSAVAASRLHLEVTETALAIDHGSVSASLDRLARHGIGMALDDFGVGYASLAHLRTLALSEVKIDRGFVAGLESSDQDREVVRSLIQLAHGLGLRVTAEGVETSVTALWLERSGCDSAQGYHFARPLPWRQLGEPAVRGRQGRPALTEANR